MKIIKSISALLEALDLERNLDKSIGFVPTMGALHEGHMALIEHAKAKADVVVASVFVNPTQFNNSADLTLYPRTPENDTKLLETHGCDIAFFPTVDEMYPEERETVAIDLGPLETVMEGKFRPGHFTGVVQVVHRFFELVRPEFAFFGQKDFQQVAVIRHMVNSLQLPVEIIPCPTLRESSGLAMSSRNMRLSADERIEAEHIYRTLSYAKTLVSNHSPTEVTELATRFFATSSMELEYFSIVNPDTLMPLTDNWVNGATACIAAYCGEVRLIDNQELIPYSL